MLAVLPLAALAACPYAHTGKAMPANHPAVFGNPIPPPNEDYAAAVAALDWAAVKADIIQLFTDSQEFWPADFGNYGAASALLGV